MAKKEEAPIIGGQTTPVEEPAPEKAPKKDVTPKRGRRRRANKAKQNGTLPIRIVADSERFADHVTVGDLMDAEAGSFNKQIEVIARFMVDEDDAYIKHEVAIEALRSLTLREANEHFRDFMKGIEISAGADPKE